MISNYSDFNDFSSQRLTEEWDALAFERYKQISSGLDITFSKFMVPLVRSLVGEDPNATLIDIGSGTGQLALCISSGFKNVICIEPSTKSIEISKSVLSGFSNICFINSYFDDVDESVFEGVGGGRKKFLAAMVLSATPDLYGFSKQLSRFSKGGDEFVATIPHPKFWPKYWGYEGESWFSYENEIMIKSPFKISLSGTDFMTTHIHRPVEKYISMMSDFGFGLVDVLEPLPDPETESLYPSKWNYPRFMAFKWVKT